METPKTHIMSNTSDVQDVPETQESSDLWRLPPEVRIHIESYLGVNDYLSLMCCCSGFRWEVSRLPDGHVYSSDLLRVFPNLERVDGPVLLCPRMVEVEEVREEEIQCERVDVTKNSRALEEFRMVSKRLEGDITILWPGQREDERTPVLRKAGNLGWDFWALPLLQAFAKRVNANPDANFQLLVSRICRLTYWAERRELEFLIPFFRTPQRSDTRTMPHRVRLHEMPNLRAIMCEITRMNLRGLAFPLLSLDKDGTISIMAPMMTDDRVRRLTHDFFIPFKSLGLLSESRHYFGPENGCLVEEVRIISLDPLEDLDHWRTLGTIPRSLRPQIQRLHGLEGPRGLRVGHTFDARDFKGWRPNLPWTFILGTPENTFSSSMTTRPISPNELIDITNLIAESQVSLANTISPFHMNLVRAITRYLPSANLRFLYHRPVPPTITSVCARGRRTVYLVHSESS